MKRPNAGDATSERANTWRASALLLAVEELLRLSAAPPTKCGFLWERGAATVPLVDAANDAVIQHALRIMEARLQAHGAALGSPQAVRDYLRLRLANRDCEVFAVLFLNSQNGLIACEEMFRGTLAQTSVYPREVVKTALKHNAAAVIFAHNHPSGIAEPSRADELLTQALKQALALVDVRALDHLVVAGGTTVSFAERGLL